LTCRCFFYSKTGSKTEFIERIKIHKLRLMIILLQICDGFVVVLPLHVSSSQSVLTNLTPGLTPELPCALSGRSPFQEVSMHIRSSVSTQDARYIKAEKKIYNIYINLVNPKSYRREGGCKAYQCKLVKSRVVSIHNEDGRKKSDQRSKRMSARLKNSARDQRSGWDGLRSDSPETCSQPNKTQFHR